ncbi:putative glycoside hydrolase [Lentibacillus saliphilus]|uniref:putative glycoside hydrolase n=1 Tax=Lentibacillus saliphilus TaxID=2737028 RepID=UPI001C310A81|nr:putative glycoside hydrolase [Lentibacillus saliphilus]
MSKRFKIPLISVMIVCVMLMASCGMNTNAIHQSGNSAHSLAIKDHDRDKGTQDQRLLVKQLANKKRQAKIDEQKEARQEEKSRDVRGIYLSRSSLTEAALQEKIDLITSTKLNAVVIDIKDDFGKLTYDSQLPDVDHIGADKGAAIPHMTEWLKKLKAHDIYVIARMVVFKDPFLAKHKTDLALKKRDGTVWQDASGVQWLDPFKEEVWSYVADVSEEIAELGVDEIQYDYVRFPENAKKVDQEVQYDKQGKTTKAEAIMTFLKEMNERLDRYAVNVSADVFGLVTSAEDDMGIGQVWEQVSPYVDYISPMTYPSHYGPGSYGVDNPDTEPYDIIKHAVKDALKRNATLKENGVTPARIRPWIQDFDLRSNYGPIEVREQIKALEELGIHQYLAWNAGSIYNNEAYR